MSFSHRSGHERIAGGGRSDLSDTQLCNFGTSHGPGAALSSFSSSSRRLNTGGETAMRPAMVRNLERIGVREGCHRAKSRCQNRAFHFGRVSTTKNASREVWPLEARDPEAPAKPGEV